MRIGWHDQRAATRADESQQVMSAARYIGASEMRLIVLWHKVQPAAGEWHWSEYDAAVERARGFNVQLTLGGIGARPPAWAGGLPQSTPYGVGSWRKLDELAYVRFAAAAARRYGARVKLWSILNEVDLTGYPARRYAALFARVRRAIRRFAGPRARLLWGDFSATAPLSYTNRALAGTGRIRADGFALHPYAGYFRKMQGGLDHLATVQRTIRGWAGRRQRRLATPGDGPLPLYATEYGCSTLEYGERECARQWDRGLTEGARHGLRELVAYQLIPTDVRSWDTSLLRADGSPSMAMRLIAVWPDRARARAILRSRATPRSASTPLRAARAR
jgi:hypothetical protein